MFSSPMGIGITENRDVFISSSKEHGIYHCSEEKIELEMSYQNYVLVVLPKGITMA